MKNLNSRLRTLFIVLSLMALISVVAGGYFYYSAVTGFAVEQAHREAAETLKGMGNEIDAELLRSLLEVKVLAGLQELRHALLSGDVREIDALNAILDHFQASLKVRVCYLMDGAGNTIASSNRRDQDSFVGRNYGFRPYFSQAMQGRPATYLALGVTSGERGIYFSHPVYGEDASVPVGVAVIKAPVDAIEARMQDVRHGMVLLTDPHGVVFFSSQPDWLYHLLWEVSPETLAEIQASRQFGSGPWQWLGMKRIDLHTAEDHSGLTYRAHQQELTQYQGWRLVSLYDHQEIMDTMLGPLQKSLGPGIILLCVFLGGIIGFLFIKANAGIAQHIEAEKVLVERETLFRGMFEEHTAVMLLIDPQAGRITRANPAAVRYYGFPAEEMLQMTIYQLNCLSEAEINQKMQGALHQQENIFEFQHLRADGQVRDVEVHSTPISIHHQTMLFSIVHDITDRRRAEEALKESEATVRKKLQAIFEPNGDMAPFEMPDIIDSQDLQLLMDDFYALTGVGGAILDTRGKILASTTWQDICSRFHRVHPQTRQHCMESDTVLASGRAPGEIGLYKCKNSMWDVVTPIHIGGHHIGNVFYGQFFFEEETPDYDTFRQQAARYGFDETAYLAALERVPRWSREKVDQIMGFYARLAGMISTLGYRNIRLARAMTANAELLETLQESEEKYRVLFSTFPLGITVSDHTGKIVESNAAAEQLLGISKGEHEKRHIDGAEWCIIRPDGSPMPAAEYASVRALKENRLIENVEMGIVKPDAEITWINVSAAPLDLDKYGAVITYGDVTARRQVEAAQALLQAQLQQAQKMESVGRLAGGVAHDFNNMLGVILGFTEMALDFAGPSEPLQKCLEEVRKAAERSTKLVQQLLAFARKQIIAPVVLDLNQTVTGMLKMLQRLIGEDIDMIWQPGPNLWAVCMDPGQIDQILANLCVNARDAIPGVGKVTIETANQVFDEDYCARHAGFRPGDFVLMAVSDNGCGMDAQTQEHIFEPFFTTKEVGQGTGLGLATIYGIVKQNNGFINVYSEPGQGTSIKIYLPRHTAGAKAVVESESAQICSGSETILLVEDEPSLLEMATQMLELWGYQVLAAGTPEEALRLAREHTGRIDLLMTDVVMPAMNGRELAHELMRLHPELKCLFMSGYTANVIAHHGVLDEGVHFIQKPFAMQALNAKLRAALA